MGILTPTEIIVFPLQEVRGEGEEVVLANEFTLDLRGEPRDSHQQRRKRSRGRQDSQSRKKRRIDEAIVAEERLRRAVLSRCDHQISGPYQR